MALLNVRRPTLSRRARKAAEFGTNLLAECSPPLQIMESKDRGKGLFATADIGPGMVVTMYPAHAIVTGRQPKMTKHDPHFSMAPENIMAYFLAITTAELGLVGDPKLCRIGAMAHMVNDACPIGDVKRMRKRTPDMSDRDTMGLVVNYNVKVKRAVNCAFIIEPDCCYLETVRHVAAGDELLVAYGDAYWLDSEAQSATSIADAVTRALRALPPLLAAQFHQMLSSSAIFARSN